MGEGKKTTNSRLLPVFALTGIVLLAACGGGGGPDPTSVRPPPEPQPEPAPPPAADSFPAYHLETPRFTTHQPYLLEQIGAHHAYAKGLTGRGVRVGIDDTIVDYTQTAEFGSRVRLHDADGAKLAYSRPLGDNATSDVDVCRSDPECQIWEGDSGGDEEAHNSWVRQIVDEEGWPTRDDSVFVVDKHYPEDGSIEQLLRWREVPTPYGPHGSHGTIVASIAAGSNLGVAPEATIIPTARNLTDDQEADAIADQTLRNWIQALPNTDRQQLDDMLALGVRDDYAKFDIINRSYGTRNSELSIVDSIESARWYDAHLPRTLDAIWQSDVPDSNKTIVVYAAGNEGDPVPNLGGYLPYLFSELRGHSLAVAATDPGTGAIAEYSNRCGPLPSDWNASRHGRHYCLVAPGTARGLEPNPDRPGRGDTVDGVTGTSIAAPVVSGALALLKEHFRGTRGNTEIVRRIVDTADRSGRYADLETYGAGHLDLEAALSPVGRLTAGSADRALSRTGLRAPAAFGAVARRADHIELAAFDAQGFPFWVPVSGMISVVSAGHSPIPIFNESTMQAASAPAPGLDVLELSWVDSAADEYTWFSVHRNWVMGFGPTSVSLARRPFGEGWGYGVSFDDNGHLGTETSGAFGTDIRSGLLWTSRAIEHEFGNGWMLKAAGMLALSVPQYEKDAMFRATPSLLSAMSMRFGTRTSGIVLEQPMRAESGAGTFRIENGRIENGKRLHDEYRISLRPDGRELRMTFRHDRKMFGGVYAIEFGGAVNSGHIPGRSEARFGFAYRAIW